MDIKTHLADGNPTSLHQKTCQGPLKSATARGARRALRRHQNANLGAGRRRASRHLGAVLDEPPPFEAALNDLRGVLVSIFTSARKKGRQTSAYRQIKKSDGS